MTNTLVDQLSDLRTYFDETEEKISNYITCQESVEGRLSIFPTIEESHKEIFFRDCEIRLKHAETTIFGKCQYCSKNAAIPGLPNLLLSTR